MTSPATKTGLVSLLTLLVLFPFLASLAWAALSLS